MKKITIFFALFLGQMNVTAQVAAKIDSNYKRPYYEQRVSLFKQLPKVKNAIVFIGNSITDGASGKNFWTAKNASIGAFRAIFRLAFWLGSMML